MAPLRGVLPGLLSVTIDAHDRAGLERLLLYCAQPVLLLERLSWRIEGGRAVFRLPKPRLDGTQHIELGVSELLDRLSQLRTPPRRHRDRYHGVLAPNAPMRPAVTARAGQPLEGVPRPVSSPAVDKLSTERPRSPAS
ncbi:MAG: transposase [Gammaproteobacteria bacterium]